MGEFASVLAALMTPVSIAALIGGSIWGVVSSAVPGMTTTVGLALLLPLTFAMDPVPAVLLMMATWSGMEFGGAIPAILINTPGSPGAAATTLDGHALFLQGKGGKALGAALVWGLLAQFVSVILCAALIIPLSFVLLGFGPLEVFAVAVFGLTILTSFGGMGMTRAGISLIFGLLIAAVGFDPFSGTLRMTFGISGLEEGIGIIPVLIGLFAVGYMLSLTRKREKPLALDDSQRAVTTQLPTWAELKSMRRAGAISTLVGLIVGLMPGAGGLAASYAAWNESRRWSKNPDLFGRGSLEGVVASESANNANIPGTIVPMLTFGVPGSPAAAVLMGGLLIQGVRPGPEIFSQNVHILWAIFIGLLIANPVVLGLGLVLIKPAIRLVSLPRPYVQAGILGLVVTGTFAGAGNVVDLVVLTVFGVVGWGVIRFGFSAGAIALGLVLGVLLESNLRRALTSAGGDWTYFLQSPIAGVFFILAALALTGPGLSRGVRAFLRRHADVPAA